MSKCAQEEQRLRSQHPELVNHVSQDGSKNKNKRVFHSKKDNTTRDLTLGDVLFMSKK